MHPRSLPVHDLTDRVGVMKSNIKKKGDTALSELARTYELVRDELADRLDGLAGRLDEIDASRLGGRALSSAQKMRSQIESRVRPTPVRKRIPWGLVVLGLSTLGIVFLLYDRRRRDMIQGRITQLGARTQGQVPASMKNGVTGAVDAVMGRGRRGTALDEDQLKSEVESAIAGAGEGGSLPDGLQIAVEGRTVYLRGTVESSIADQAAARAQQVEGVAAVVNLTSTPQPGSVSSTRPSTTPRRAGSA